MGGKHKPVLDQVNVVAADMEASVAFYRALGLDIPDWEPAWDAHHRSAKSDSGADMDLDSERFAAYWCTGFAEQPARPVLNFRFQSREAIDEVHAELTGLGYRSLQAPRDMFWGSRFAVVEDPSGNAVGLMSPADPERRSSPPDPASLLERGPAAQRDG